MVPTTIEELESERKAYLPKLDVQNNEGNNDLGILEVLEILDKENQIKAMKVKK